jgi:uncharacterized protein (TIGR02246 family)
MKKFFWLLIGCTLLAIGGEGFWLSADESAGDEAAIRKAAADYVEAYQKGDAKALAALWGPDAEYLNPTSGRRVKGRQAIEQEFDRIFKQGGASQLEVTIHSIRFLTPDVAIEEGEARVTPEGEAPEESTYMAIHVKRDGRWLLESVRETDLPVRATSYEHLKELEWMVGTWVDSDEEAAIETTCRWTKNKNFLTRNFRVIIGEHVDMEGTQVIGWDPAAGRIRSWVFDSDGGFAEGVWTRKDNRWVIHSVGTLPDGGQATAINILTYIDNDTLTWQTTGREVDGEILPNVDPVTVKRVPALNGPVAASNDGDQ